MMACSVEHRPGLGYVVLSEDTDGLVHVMPKTLPGEMIVFDQRRHAERLADAIDADDMPVCHELITEFGRVAKAAV